jgi:hypothetical protein
MPTPLLLLQDISLLAGKAAAEDRETVRKQQRGTHALHRARTQRPSNTKSR